MAAAHAPTVLGSDNPVRFNPCTFDIDTANDSTTGHARHDKKTIQNDKDSIVQSVHSKIENLKYRNEMKAQRYEQQHKLLINHQNKFDNNNNHDSATSYLTQSYDLAGSCNIRPATATTTSLYQDPDPQNGVQHRLSRASLKNRGKLNHNKSAAKQ